MVTLTIVIPVYNETKRIEKTLKTLRKGFNCPGVKLDKLIFVDDGSGDGVLRKLKAYKKGLEKSLKVKVDIISYSPNRGRGYAVRNGTNGASSDCVLYVDADLSISLTNLTKFKPFLEKGYDLLFGSKKKPGACALIPRSITRNVVGYGHSIIASLVLGVIACDFQGGFKIFSRKFIDEVFPSLTMNRWGFDMEVIFLAKKLGYKTVELPVIWSHVENGSKVKLLRDIFRSLKDMYLIRKNWFVRNCLPKRVLAFPVIKRSSWQTLRDYFGKPLLGFYRTLLNL